MATYASVSLTRSDLRSNGREIKGISAMLTFIALDALGMLRDSTAALGPLAAQKGNGHLPPGSVIFEAKCCLALRVSRIR
jgi:hypothetical protein